MAFLLISALIINLGNIPLAHANISSCSDTNVTPHTVTPNSTTGFSISLRNTDANTIRWINVTQPSGHFNIGGASASGWTTDYYSDHVELRSGSLGSGATLSITITASVPNVEASEANWIVQVSDDAGGTNLFYCSGSLGTSIEGGLNDEIPPTISNVRLSQLTSTSVTVSWTTDENTTPRIDYGLTEDYGQTKSSTTLATNHSLTITGLTPDTGYHYLIISQDSSSNISYADGTFLTAVAGTAGSQESGTNEGTGTTSTIPSPTGTTRNETLAPTVTLTTVLDKPYQQAPGISGGATDNVALSRIDYSTDGGVNWQRVTQATGLGSKKASFSFTPVNLEDGNYQVLARAIDTSGNIGTSSALSLIIDTGPPVIGGLVFNLGAQLIIPSSSGLIILTAGSDQRLTLNAGGGPISMSVVTEGEEATDSTKQLFTLTRSITTGLWSGIISFKAAGEYILKLEAVDGAGNQVNLTLVQALVIEPGQVQDKITKKPITDATVTLYYFEPVTERWRIWDSQPFGQTNPQSTSDNGGYQFLVPAGRYYIEVISPTHRTTQTQAFNLHQPTNLTATLPVESKSRLSFGSRSFYLPGWTLRSVNVAVDSTKIGSTDLKLSNIGQPWPEMSLPTTNDGRQLTTVGLYGRPTVITVVNTWSPAAKEQLSILAEVGTNKDLNVFPIFPIESLARIQVYGELGDYDLEMVSDREGKVAKQLPMLITPTHYFINRKGIVKDMIVGVLSEDELLSRLTQL